MKRYLLLLLAVSLLQAALYHWSGDSTVVLEERLILQESDSLIVEPGCSIYVDSSAGIVADVGSYISAVGTPTNPIYFTIAKKYNNIPAIYWKGIMCSRATMKLQHLTVNQAYLGISYLDWEDQAIISFAHLKNCYKGITLSGRHNDTLHHILFEECAISLEIAKKDSTVFLTNATSYSTKAYPHGAIESEYRGTLHMTNSIIYNKYGFGFLPKQTSTAKLISDYNCYYTGKTALMTQSPGVQDLIGKDPLFENGKEGNFHLASNSPAIDAGDPLSDYSMEPHRGGERVNMGYYGNTNEAKVATKAAVISDLPQNAINFPHVELKIALPENSTISLYTLKGKQLLTVETLGVETLDLSTMQLVPGFYLLRSTNKASGAVHSQRVLIK